MAVEHPFEDQFLQECRRAFGRSAFRPIPPSTKVNFVVGWGRATAGTTLSAGDLPAHTHVADIVSGALPFTIQNNGAAVGTRRALNLIQGANIGLTFLDVPASDRVNVTVALASVPAHVHAEADVTSLTTDLAGKAALSHTHSEANITGLVADLAAKAAISHTHAEADITGLVSDLAGKAASSHTHTSSQITDATASATARWSSAMARAAPTSRTPPPTTCGRSWTRISSPSSAARSRRSAGRTRTC